MALPVSTKPKPSPSAASSDEALFEDFPRILYRRNPLEFVICEVRFPPVLKLDVEIPAGFQDQIRNEYPLFQEIVPINLSGQSPGELLKLLGGPNPIPMVKSYEFLSADKMWNLALTREAMSLTCKQYSRWEEFRQRFELPFKALIEHYPIPFFVRIGLRYRDAISRQKLELQDIPWSELLHPWVAGEFHSPLAALIVGNWHNIVFKLQTDEIQIQLQHGLQPSSGNPDTPYIFDTDFSTSARKEPQHVFDVLKFCNKYSWRVFRSCILERLHDAMGPQPL